MLTKLLSPPPNIEKKQFIRRYVVTITLLSVGASLVITMLVMRLTVDQNYLLGICIAVVTPLLVAGPVSFLYANMLFKSNMSMERIAILSRTDELTGLFNRRYFFELAASCLALGQRHGHPVSLLWIDLDHFKSVNDCFGHLTGDEVLKRSTSAFKQTIRETDILARFGGEEFVLLTPHTDCEEVLQLCQRLRQELARHQAACDDQCPQVTISIGAACSVQCGYDIDVLLARADQAMYQAKDNGRDTFVLLEEPIQPPSAACVALQKQPSVAFGK